MLVGDLGQPAQLVDAVDGAELRALRDGHDPRLDGVLVAQPAKPANDVSGDPLAAQPAKPANDVSGYQLAVGGGDRDELQAAEMLGRPALVDVQMRRGGGD